MSWKVLVTKNAEKQISRLPEIVVKNFSALVYDIESNGPVRGNWPNFGIIGKSIYHCHVKKGKPTYVAVWKTRDKVIKLVEVYYVGTHEKAPY